MRALVLTKFGELRVEERPTPSAAADEVLIRVVATGICGSDIHGYTGDNGRRVPGQVMGHESVGRVAALGENAEDSGLALEQVVTFNPVVVPPTDAAAYAGREQHSPNKTVIGVVPEIPAAFADYLVVPARNVVPLPEGIPVEYGALVEPLAVAAHAVRRVLVASDRRALVVGGGPIGQSVVLALTMKGVETIYVSEVDPGRRGARRRRHRRRRNQRQPDGRVGLHHPGGPRLPRRHGLVPTATGRIRHQHRRAQHSRQLHILRARLHRRRVIRRLGRTRHQRVDQPRGFTGGGGCDVRRPREGRRNRGQGAREIRPLSRRRASVRGGK